MHGALTRGGEADRYSSRFVTEMTSRLALPCSAAQEGVVCEHLQSDGSRLRDALMLPSCSRAALGEDEYASAVPN